MAGVLKRTGPVAHLSARSGEQRASIGGSAFRCSPTGFCLNRAEHRMVKFLGAHRSNHSKNDIAMMLQELSLVEQLSFVAASTQPSKIAQQPRAIRAQSTDGRWPFVRHQQTFYKGSAFNQTRSAACGDELTNTATLIARIS